MQNLSKNDITLKVSDIVFNKKGTKNVVYQCAGHKVIDLSTKTVIWRYPLVLDDPRGNFHIDALTEEAMREYSKVNDMDIIWTLYGSHKVRALMVPCLMTYGDTCILMYSEEEQHAFYCALCDDEWYAQYKATKDGRCVIRDKNGNLKTCPTHIKNPNYAPNGPKNSKINPKKISNRCDHCKFKNFRQKSNETTFSCLKADNEVDFPENQSALPSVNAISFVATGDKLLNYIITRSPRLKAVAYKMIFESDKKKISEMARELGIPRSTFFSQVEKIREIAEAFWLEEFGHLPAVA